MSEDTARMAAILEHYGADVPTGYGDRWRPMKCCFHEDDHASASYNEELDSFACLACQAKGNAVTLLMQQERLSAREADARATELAGHPGLSLHRASPRSRGGSYVPPRLRRRQA
jgi:DNA primase